MSFWRTLCVTAVILITMAGVKAAGHQEKVRPRRPFTIFPLQVGEWVGQQDRFDMKITKVLGVDDYFLCNYRSLDGSFLQLYVGFYQSQREGDLIHSPKNCMPGAGWHIIDASTEELLLPRNEPQRIEVIKLLLEKGDQRQIVLYWFQSRGRFIASEYMQKVYLVIDSIIQQRTDGSFVRLIAPVIDGQEEHTLNYMKTFASAVIPILREYIPS
jgi:EpsI family protein